jgi:hypothetical protein
MPPAIDAIGKLDTSFAISFSAAPSLSFGESWVVRLSRKGRSGTVEIVRLRRRSDCNLYAIERQWKAPISLEEYRAAARAVGRWSVPAPDTFWTNNPRAGEDYVVVDGTMLELRVQTSGWEVRRDLNQFAITGEDLSAIFRAFVTKQVPAEEMPAKDWSTRKGERGASQRDCCLPLKW